MMNEPDPGPGTKKAGMFGDVDTDATLWVLLPRAAVSVATAAVLTLLVFWLHDGELDAFAFGFTGFLVVLQILMIVGLRFRNRADVHVTKPAKGDLIDKIGGLWLIACAFGALFGWTCGQLAVSWPAYRILFYSASVVFSIILPVLTMLPNLRYLQARAAAIQVPILVLVTGLAAIPGLNAIVILAKNFGS